MTLYWPQLAYMTLILISLGAALAQHGKPKTGNESFWVSLFSTALALWLLYMGGFFK